MKWVAMSWVAMSVLLLTACGDEPRVLIDRLEVVSWEPNRGATCVATDVDNFAARITFSDDLDSATVTPETLFVRPAGGQPVAGRVEPADRSATLRIEAPLEHEVEHEIVVTEEIRGLEQGRLIAEIRSSFVTIGVGGCY